MIYVMWLDAILQQKLENQIGRSVSVRFKQDFFSSSSMKGLWASLVTFSLGLRLEPGFCMIMGFLTSISCSNSFSGFENYYGGFFFFGLLVSVSLNYFRLFSCSGKRCPEFYVLIYRISPTESVSCRIRTLFNTRETKNFKWSSDERSAIK